MKIVQLHENIYIRRHTRYVSTDRLINELQKKNIKLVLSVAPLTDAPFVEAARKAGITYYHAPLRDNSYVPTHDVQRLVHTVVDEVIRGNSVMIHCNQARNRSPLIAILAIIKLTGRESREALHAAREVRPKVLKFFEKYVMEHGSDGNNTHQAQRRPNGKTSKSRLLSGKFSDAINSTRL
jgi:protein-tyrosine phosphatase